MKELGKNIKSQIESTISSPWRPPSVPQTRRNQILSEDFEEIYDEETECIKVSHMTLQTPSNEPKPDARHLVKHSFVVELNEGRRYLSHLFLFPDVLVCTTHKTGGEQEQTILELEWIIPISQVRAEG